MNLANVISHGIRLARRQIVEHAPQALKIAGAAASVTSVVMLCKASYNYRGVRDRRRYSWAAATTEERKEIVTTIAKLYGPGIVVGIGGIACLLMSGRLTRKKQIALESAYVMLSESANTYQQKVIERLGEDAHRDILQEMADEDRHGLPEEPPAGAYYAQGNGDTLVYDRVTGRMFWSSPQHIREAESTVVKRCADEMYVTLNTFYEELGLPDYSFVGDAIGWDLEKCPPDIVFRSMLEDDRPVLVLNYSTVVIHPNELKRA